MVLMVELSQMWRSSVQRRAGRNQGRNIPQKVRSLLVLREALVHQQHLQGEGRAILRWMLQVCNLHWTCNLFISAKSTSMMFSRV